MSDQQERFMKTIGVLGGIGPQATMDFEARVHAISQRLITQRFNSGYPPMVVVYHRNPPVLIKEHGLPVLPIQPDPSLLASAELLGKISDFLVITANGPHLLEEQIAAAYGGELLSMIAVTLDALQAAGVKRVGLLAFGEPLVYQKPLDDLGIAHFTIPAALREPLDEAIGRYMEGTVSPASQEAARRAVAYLRENGAEWIVLGCTELPLILGDDLDQPDLVNPAELLAEAAVARAMEAA